MPVEQKAIGIGIALLVTAIMVPIGLDQLSGMDEESTVIENQFVETVDNTTQGTLDIGTYDNVVDATVYYSWDMIGDNTGDLTVNVNSSSQVTGTVDNTGDNVIDVADAITTGEQTFQLSITNDNYNSLRATLDVTTESSSTLGNVFGSITTLLMTLLPVLAVIGIVVKFTNI